MLKRWADWPRGIRWLAGIAVVVLALAIVWALLVPVADWLAHHDVGSAKGSLQTARDAARGRLLTLAAGLLAAGALVFTARNFILSRRTFELTEQGQVTDRYTKAIEQLGSDKLDVRIGGIYALERVARDSARDHPTVMEVLTAFIREHSREPRPSPDSGGQEEHVRDAGLGQFRRSVVAYTAAPVFLAVVTDGRLARQARARRARSTRLDVQAAATVVGRRNPWRDIQHIDLSGADLSGAHLSRADLCGADLFGADLCGADLRGAVLFGAHLFGADLCVADLRRAVLFGANLFGADLRDAEWSEDAPVPEGWKLDADSGRLERTGIGSGPAEAD